LTLSDVRANSRFAVGQKQCRTDFHSVTILIRQNCRWLNRLRSRIDRNAIRVTVLAPQMLTPASGCVSASRVSPLVSASFFGEYVMIKLFAGLKRFVKEQDAPTMAEYGLLLVFIALVVAAGAAVLGDGISTLFQSAGSAIGNAPIPTLPGA
jgi:Flp pilus assembly pilin Flp